MRLWGWMKGKKIMRPLYEREVTVLTNGSWEGQRQARASLEAGLRSEETWVRQAAEVALVSAGVGADLLNKRFAERYWERIRPTLFTRVRSCLFKLVNVPSYIDIELQETSTEVTATVKGSPSVIVVTLGRDQVFHLMPGEFKVPPHGAEIDAMIVSFIQTAADAVLAEDALSRLPPAATYRDCKKVMEELRCMVVP